MFLGSAVLYNGIRLSESDYTTELDTKYSLQIYEKLSYEALNRHFCKTAVSCWASFCKRSVVTSLHCPRAMAWWLLWNF